MGEITYEVHINFCPPHSKLRAFSVATIAVVGITAGMLSVPQVANAASTQPTAPAKSACVPYIYQGTGLTIVSDLDNNFNNLEGVGGSKWLITSVEDPTKTLEVADNTSSEDQSFNDDNGSLGWLCLRNPYKGDQFFVEGQKYTIQQIGTVEGYEPAQVGTVNNSAANANAGNIPQEQWVRLDKEALTFTWTKDTGGDIITQFNEKVGTPSAGNWIYMPKEAKYSWSFETADSAEPSGTEWKVLVSDSKYYPRTDDRAFTVVDNDEHDQDKTTGKITLTYPDVFAYSRISIQQLKATEGYRTAVAPEGSQPYDGEETVGSDVAFSGIGTRVGYSESLSAYLTFVMPKAANIVYDGNGATAGSVEAFEGNLDETTTVAENGFTFEGKEFTGWNTAADGSGDSYTAGAPITLDAVSTTLYAQWKEPDTGNGTGTGTVVPPATTPNPANPVGTPVALVKKTPATAGALATTGSDVTLFAMGAATLLAAGLALVLKRHRA